ncbi:MAG: TonB-dependent receptor [Spongiibacteraceae bacterium]|jgi:iron complex outermembrane receptor protein|nr:TonB-dependent receptor [Spongiibacteraceae bacterium]
MLTPLKAGRSGHLRASLKPLAVLCGALSVGAVAQEQPRASGALEEVVVSARRVEESLQTTPVSVVALGGEKLEQMGVDSLSTFDAFVPNLSTGAPMGGGNLAVFTIRGIGGGQGTVSHENSVGVYIDEIYMARPNGGLLDLIDVGQVEVLRGPQGTLFGRNTSGGAVIYHTKRPDHEFGGEVKGAIGSYDRRDVTGIVNIPFTDTLAGRFTYASATRDGFVKRLNDGQKMGNKDVQLARGQLRWTPTDDWTVDFAAAHLQSSTNGVATHISAIDPTDLLPSRLGNPGYNDSLLTHDRYKVRGGSLPDINDYESTSYSLLASYQLNDNIEFRSLTGYNEANHRQRTDYDLTEFDVWMYDETYDIEYYSQEFQLNGTTFDDRLNWVTGIFYLHEESRQDRKRFLPTEPAGNPEYGDTDNTSYAVFAQGTYSLTDKLSATLGVRWNKDEKDYAGGRGTAEAENDDDWENVSTRIGIEYELTPDVMLYASRAEGFRAGGFNDRPRPGQLNDGLIPYDPEELVTYEIGFRSEFWDNRARLNATYFFTEYDDIQVQTAFFDPRAGTNIQVTQNAGAAEVEGIELEALVMLTDRLTLNASFGWIDAKYTDVGNSPTLTKKTPFQFTPEYSYTIGLTYTQPLQGADLDLSVDYGWKDEQTNNNTETNYIWMPDYGLLNARVSYTPHEGNWSVALFGTNLLDEEYLIGAMDLSTGDNYSGFISEFLGRPREVGVELKVTF